MAKSITELKADIKKIKKIVATHNSRIKQLNQELELATLRAEIEKLKAKS